MTKDIHVAHSGGGWEVKEEGTDRVDRYPTREKAVEAGRKLAQRNRSQHVIHGRDGRIHQSDSYGSDPFPPRVSS